MNQNYKRKNASRARNNSEWGKMIDIICSILATDMSALALRAGLVPSTVTKATVGERFPAEETTVALWNIIQQEVTARDQGEKQSRIVKTFTDPLTKDAFYNLAGHSTPEQRRVALEKREELETLKYYILEIERREHLLDQGEKTIERSNQLINELNEAREELQREVRVREQRIVQLQAVLEGKGPDTIQEPTKDEIIRTQREEIERLKGELDLYTRKL
jgi:hypothetical protein